MNNHAIYTEKDGKKIVVIGSFDGAHVTIGDHARHAYGDDSANDPFSQIVTFFAGKAKVLARTAWRLIAGLFK